MTQIKEIIINLGWPHVALIFAVLFSLLFRKHIGFFISRIKSVSKSGIDTNSLPRGQSDKEQKDAVKQLMDIDTSPALTEQETLIKEDITQRGLDLQGDTVAVLIRHLAATQIALAFEQAYSNIFGSQINLLKKLNGAAGIGLEPKIVGNYFETVKNAHTQQYQNWNIDQYLQHLRNHVLITIENGNYHITVRGQDFLTWLARVGYPEDKSL